MSSDHLFHLLKARTNARTLARGRQYYIDGRVGSLEVGEGGTLHSVVRGTRPYQVSMGFADKGFWCDCTCPAWDFEGVCKHVVALALVADAEGISQAVVREAIDAPANPEGHVGSRSGVLERYLADAETTLSWQARLDRLESGARRRREDPVGGDPANPAQFEIWIAPETCRMESGLVLQLLRRTVRKQGGFSDPQAATWASLDSYTSMSHDVRLALGRAQHMAREERGRWGSLRKSQILIPPADSAHALQALAGVVEMRCADEEGRPGEPLRWTREPWRFALELESFDDEGTPVLRLDGTLRQADRVRSLPEARLLLAGGVALFPTEVGPLDDVAAFDWVLAIRQDGPLEVRGEESGPFLARLLDVAVGVPLELGDLASPAGVPEGWIDLALNARGHADAAVLFDYDGARISAAHPSPYLAGGPDGTQILKRNEEAERVLLATFAAEGGVRGASEWGTHPYRLPFDELARRCGRLIEAGWQVRVENKALKSAGSLSVRVQSGIDWFDIQGEATFDQSALPLPQILRAVSEGRRFLTLDGGGAALLPPEWIPRLEALCALVQGEPDGASVQVSRARAPLLDLLLADLADVQVDEGYKALQTTLRNFKGISPRREVKAFQGELRDYQRETLGWFDFLRRSGLGGCLADDMGLGKTVQVLACLLTRRRSKNRRGPSLVVAPRSVMTNWIREAERFAPSLRTATYHGPNRAGVLHERERLDLIVTTYGTMRRDIEALAEIPLDYAILDESQAIKNTASKTARAARLLDAGHRLALSGTPIENHLDELGSLFAFLNPGLLGTKREFQTLLGATGTPDPERMEWLRSALKPLILRRTREQVLTELPAKEEQILYCPLVDEQRLAYDRIREHYRASVLSTVETQGLSRSKMHVLEALLRLRQAACHPGLMDSSRSGESAAKLEQLLPMLEEISDAGHKALVFSQFTKFLGIVRQRLDDMGIRYEYMDGRTQKRHECIDRFQGDPDSTAFLISLKAGGTGLNLTAAQYVFLLDPWWNPAVEAQAIGRAHRMGQENPVTVYRLIGEDTVEDRVLELQARKRELVQAVLGGVSDTPLSGITHDDLELLLG